jgi:hypothetical protein
MNTLVRLFLGASAACLFAAFAGDRSEARAATSPAAAQGDCKVVHASDHVELWSPAFVFCLDTSDGLRAHTWKNRLTGRQLALGDGTELELDLDAAARRIGIREWRVGPPQSGDDPARLDFDDAKWGTATTPQSAGWARTRVVLPAGVESQTVSLTVGGFGLFDFRQMQVFLNGHALGGRQAEKRWTEPAVFDLGPATPAHRYLRFGETNHNVIALRLEGYVNRTARLDELDTTRTTGFNKDPWPGQFEQYVTVGGPLETPKLRVADVAVKQEGRQAEAVVQLVAASGAVSAVVTYRWDAAEPVLHKFVRVRNESKGPVRLLNVRLGNYQTGAVVSEGEQGFPVYVDSQFFATLAHPSGWAVGQDGEVRLRQYPGRGLAAGETFQCMEAVLGVSPEGAARKAFLAHVRQRSRRVARGHDQAYAIFETFGSRPGGDFNDTEEHVLDTLAKVAEGQREAGCHFDICSLEFWVDYRGDLKRCDPQRFPNGLSKIRAELKPMGTALGLWIDSSMQSWSIGGNPATKPSLTHNPHFFCRATEPIKTMYADAFRYHLREDGARLFKFDNLSSICYNPRHAHLPGVYSTEAIQSSIIEFLDCLDAECPEVFLMLYWGYRSPWWLLHADTLFEPGLAIEAASPGPSPALYVRDSVTEGLDQAQWWCEDVPPLGKDSLGVWLSDWPWNSSVGKERWQEGFVMDICRGSLLAQVWTDTPWLTPTERRQMAEFIALVKERAACFANPRFVLGNPWRHEPYGYCCTDGSRAFIALNNCTWSDATLELELNPAWGLLDKEEWDLYRWYPAPARLAGERKAFGKTAALALRPFEIVLLEAVPSGQPPSLGRHFEPQPIPVDFAEASRPVGVSAAQIQDQPELPAGSSWTILEPSTAVASGGAILTRQADRSILASGANPSPETYTIIATTELTGITAIRLEVLPDPSLPGGGPGRAANGNFALSEFRVAAAPKGDPAQTKRVVLRNPVADFWQQTHGGWPVSATIDGNPNTAWSIDPQEGWPHAAMFETTEPLGFTGGTTLTFVLDQQPPKEHNLGRLRLSVSTAKPPVPLGVVQKPRLAVSGKAPASTAGGTLVVTAEMRRGSAPFMVGDASARFTVQGTVGGRDVLCEPAVRGPGYPVSWQAWRIALKPSSTPQPFELRLDARTPPDVELTLGGHFVPLAPGSLLKR